MGGIVKRLLLFFSFFIPVALFAQQPYIDFETVGNDWSYGIFGQGTGGTFDIVANPDPSGFNTSDSVACIVIDADGEVWGGVFTGDFPAGAGGSLTLDATNSIITVMVYKDFISDVNLN
jgi:hypothetical protein